MTRVTRGVARLNEWVLIQGGWKHKLALQKVKWFNLTSHGRLKLFLIKNFIIYEFNVSIFSSEVIALQFMYVC